MMTVIENFLHEGEQKLFYWSGARLANVFCASRAELFLRKVFALPVRPPLATGRLESSLCHNESGDSCQSTVVGFPLL